MPKLIKWGIVGCGDVTEMKSGPAFQKAKGSALLAVMRRDGEKAKSYAQRHNVPYWYDNAEDLINNNEVNAIYIATPPGSHAKYAIMAMKAGKPVYVEKPMAASYSECVKMNEVSEQTGQPLFVAYYRRLLPGFARIKEILDQGIIGKPSYFTIRYMVPVTDADKRLPLPWRLNPEISGGGYIYDLGSHQLDLIDYLLGPIEEVASVSFNQNGYYEPEDIVSAGFRLNNNIAGNGVWSFGAPDFLGEDKMEIVGDKGKLCFSCFGFSPIILTVKEINSYFDNIRPAHVQQNMIQSVVDELRGTGKCPSTGISAARTSRILDMLTHKKEIPS